MKKKMITSITAVLLGLCAFGYAGMVTGLSANPVAYYSFDNSGDLGHDDSGNGYNLVIQNSEPAYDASGKIGGACVTGTTAAWDVSNVMTGSAFTVVTYVKASADAIGTYARVLMPAASATSDGLHIFINSYEWRDVIYFNGSVTGYQDANVPAVADEWIQLAVTYTPETTNGTVYTGTLRQYADGVLTQTKTNVDYQAAADYVIGGYTSTTYAFKGAVDEMYFFDAALTDTDMVLLAGRDPTLVAYYSFDDENDLGHDDSGNGHNLITKYSTPAYDASGKSGGACITDTNAGWRVSNTLEGSAFTVAVYAKASADAIGTLGRVLVPDSGIKGEGFQIYINQTTWRDAIYCDGAYTAIQDGGAPVVADEWIHLAATYTPDSTNGTVYTGTLRQYVNGALAVTSAGVDYRAAVDYVIGCDAPSVGFRGAVDEMYFFNVALSDREVAQLSGISIPDHLVARWTFDDPNNRAFDSAYNGHTLTMPSESLLSYAPGRVGDAVHITTNQTEFKVAGVLGPTFTVAGFFKADADNDGSDKLFSYNTSSAGLSIYTYQNDIRFMTRYNPSSYTFASSSLNHVPGGGWQHLAMSFVPDGAADENGNYTGTMKGYVNGALAATKTDAIYNPNAELRMSGYSDSYLGMMDEINVFDTALTDSEIYDLSLRIPGYPGWAEQWGVDIGAATDDYDGDGLINLYEYALGGNPTNALDTGTSPQFGTVEQGGTTYFGYVYPQVAAADSGLTYSLETSTNLVSGTWTNAGITVLGTNVTGDTLNMVSNYTDTVDSQKFIRLMISTNTP